ncbi:MAG: DUF6660 family protein [Saprospiraceae bacterium]
MKRALIILFSFYLLALGVIPCSDKDDCKYQSTELIMSNSTDHSDHDSDTENCSPFCMCDCCGQTFSCNPFFNYSLSLSVPISLEKFPIYKTSFVSEVYLSIWQPPKIS